VVGFALVCFALAVRPLHSQERAAGPQGGSYASIARLPDWSGTWEMLPDPNYRGGGNPFIEGAAPLRPELRDRVQQQRQRLDEIGFPYQDRRCIVSGTPSVMYSPNPFEFLFTPRRVTIALENQRETRRIYTNGATHLSPDPSYEGDSVGHWEHDTLVVETINLRPDNLGVPGVVSPRQPYRITERMHILRSGQLEIATTIYDDELYTSPFTIVRHYARRPWRIMEDVCENPRDQLDPNGNPIIDLTPPK
jgi:hypothetical protein